MRDKLITVKEKLIELWGKTRSLLKRVHIPNNSWKALLLHTSVMLGITTLIVLYFFKVYLPNTTNHGEEFKMLDFRGKTLSDAKNMMLQHEWRDSVYKREWSPGHEPNTIISQSPSPGSIVKRGRRVYLVLNKDTPPRVKITGDILKKIRYVSNSDAIYNLHTLNLKVCATYMWRENRGYVYNCSVDGKTIEAGDEFPEGTMVLLHIGKGTGAENKRDKYYDNEHDNYDCNKK